jgi:hypothetical protein
MKKLLSLAALCALACSANIALAQDYIAATYDLTPDGTNQFGLCNNLWGDSGPAYTLDGSKDGSNSLASGSVRMDCTLAGTGGDAFVSKYGFADTNAYSFTNLEFDIYWSAASPQGNWYFGPFYGHLDFGYTTDSGTIDPGQSFDIHLADAGHWVHEVLPVPITVNTLVNGIYMKMYCGGYGNPNAGTITYWLDNIKLTGRKPASTPPILSIEKSIPGLRIWASQIGNDYQREEIVTLNNDHHSWYGNTPKSYSMTITNFPNQTHVNFQAHMFLIPLASMPPGDLPSNGYEDFHASNIVMVAIINAGNGTTTGRFMIKTNASQSDGDMRTVGTLGVVTNAGGALGTWTVTFTDNTHASLTAPSGATTGVFSIPQDVTLFQEPLAAYFGVDPNSTVDTGQSATFSHIKITGADPIDDTLTTLDSFTWQVISMDPPGTVFVPTDSAYWISWPLQSGFGLVTNASLSAPSASWGSLGIAPTTIWTKAQTLISSTNLVPGGKEFFKAFNPGM